MNPPNMGFIQQLFPLIIIVFIFYFLVIRPQQAKQAEHKRMVSELKKNDAVVTSGGILGTIVNVKDDTVIVRVDDNVKIEVQKMSIVSVKKTQE